MTQKLSQFCPSILGKKCKAIALLFGQKLVIFIRAYFGHKIVPIFSWSIWGKNARLYSLLWPKDGHFYWRIFRAKNCPNFFLVNLGQKCKAIVLLFGQKLVIFIREFFGQETVPILSLSSLGKMRGYSLTFLAKNWSFLLENVLTQKLSQFCPFQFWAKMQGYSLTFLPRIGHFYWRIFWAKNCPNFFLVNLGQKCKAIFLTLAKRGSFLLENISGKKLSQFFPGQFGAKMRGYSLTFWPKIGHFY